MRKTILLVLGFLVLHVWVFTPRAMFAQARPFPEIISLPDGFRPEGVVTGRGPILYAGSLGTGAIYQADLRTGEGSILVAPQEGRTAVGLGFDQRTKYIYALVVVQAMRMSTTPILAQRSVCTSLLLRAASSTM